MGQVKRLGTVTNVSKNGFINTNILIRGVVFCSHENDINNTNLSAVKGGSTLCVKSLNKVILVRSCHSRINTIT